MLSLTLYKQITLTNKLSAICWDVRSGVQVMGRSAPCFALAWRVLLLCLPAGSGLLRRPSPLSTPPPPLRPHLATLPLKKPSNKITCTQKSCNWDWTVLLGPRSKTEAPASNLVALLKSHKKMKKLCKNCPPHHPNAISIVMLIFAMCA